MTGASFVAELARYGPQAIDRSRPTIDEAQRYCRTLARRHYENFTVASLLAPRRLRQHLCNIYAYCRWADDLADETPDAASCLELLDWWEDQLRECYRGRSTHPVFVALDDTIARFDIPIQPLADLLIAFRLDQRQTRYETFDDLLGYCRNSANPVGRLVLRLSQRSDDEQSRLSDSICTGLQLANFCQDVSRDYSSGRIYLPRESWLAAGYDERQFERREFNAAFRDLMRREVDRAEEFLRTVAPLVRLSSPAIRLQVDLFVRGGLAILDAIRRIDYNVWRVRPTVSRFKKLSLVAGCWWRHGRGRAV